MAFQGSLIVFELCILGCELTKSLREMDLLKPGRGERNERVFLGKMRLVNEINDKR